MYFFFFLAFWSRLLLYLYKLNYQDQQGKYWSLGWLNESILYYFYTETWLEKEIMACGKMLLQNHHVNTLYKMTLVLLWLKCWIEQLLLEKFRTWSSPVPSPSLHFFYSWTSIQVDSWVREVASIALRRENWHSRTFCYGWGPEGVPYRLHLP